MNTLSWLVYAAEALPTLKSVLGHLAIWGGLGAGIFALIVVIAAGVGHSDNDEGAKAFSKWGATILKRLIPIIMVFTFGWVAIPTSSTIYMIAASEAGEAIVTTPEAREIFGDLKSIIKKRLKAELED